MIKVSPLEQRDGINYILAKIFISGSALNWIYDCLTIYFIGKTKDIKAGGNYII